MGLMSTSKLVVITNNGRKCFRDEQTYGTTGSLLDEYYNRDYDDSANEEHNYRAYSCSVEITAMMIDSTSLCSRLIV